MSTQELFFVPLTKDVVEEVHENQHPTHQGDKENHFQRRVQEKLSTVSFALSPSSACQPTIQPVPATNRKTFAFSISNI